MSFTNEQTELLKAPLNMANVKPPKQYGPKGDYIEGWHAMAEANRIFGFDGWQYEIIKNDCVHQAPREIGKDKKPGFGVTYVSTVRVIAQGVIREDVGSGHGYDVDCGLAHESAIKEAVTDALKRALRSFGNQFGLALYDKERANVTHEDPAKATFITMMHGLADSQTNTTDLSELYNKNLAQVNERLSAGEIADMEMYFKKRARAIKEQTVKREAV